MIVKHTLSADAGELSPWLDSRTDIAKYGAGFRTLKNFIVLPQGGVTKRPGMERRGELTAGATTGRLIEFQISSASAAILALGGGELRIWINGTMLLTADVVPVPYALVIPWADADLSLLRWKQINDVMWFVHPDYAPYKLTHLSDISWALAAADFGTRWPMLAENADADHTITVTPGSEFTPTNWAAATSYTVGAKATVVSSGITYICEYAHKSGPDFSTRIPDWESGKAYAVGVLVVSGGWSGDVYRCTQAHTSSGSNAPYSSVWVRCKDISTHQRMWRQVFVDVASTIGQAVALTATRDTWDVSGMPADPSLHIGSVWEIATQRAADAYESILAATVALTGHMSTVLAVQGAWKFETFGTWYGSFIIMRSLDNGVTWEDLRSYASSSDNPRNVSAEGNEDTRALMRLRWVATGAGSSEPRGILSAMEAQIRGWVRITGVTDARTAAAVTLSVVEHGTTQFFREGAWSDYQGWPRCLEIHQSRLLLASTARKPHSIWGSATDDYPNFYLGTDADMAFCHTLVIGERDPILWMVSEKSLLIGAGSGEFVMRGGNEDSAITPEFGHSARQSSFGSHGGGVSGIFSDSVALFLQRGGTRVREFFYKLESDRYESSNLNILADHIFANLPVEDTAIMRMPFQVIWFVCDGKFYGLTYERNQNVIAWHRHETQGDVLSMATIRTAGAEDEVWFLVDRGAAMQVERFRPNAITNPQDDGWWSDAAAQLDAPYDLDTVPHLDGAAAYAYARGEFSGPVVLDGGTWPFVTAMLVSGFSNVMVDGVSLNPNGRYPVAGERNGKPWYSLSHQANAEQFSMQWVLDGSASAGHWEFLMNYAAAYAAADSVATPDLVAAWTPGAGFAAAGTIAPVSENPADIPPVLLATGGAADGVNGSYQPVAANVWSKASYLDITGGTVPEWTIRYNATVSRWEAGPLALALLRAGAAAATPADVTVWNHALTGVPTATVVTAEAVVEDPPVILGLRYDALYFPMKPEVALANGSSRSRELRIHRLVPSLYRSRSGKFGQTAAEPLLPLNAGSAAALFTGEIEKAFPGGFSDEGNFCIVSDEPVPFAIRSVCIKFNAHGDTN